MTKKGKLEEIFSRAKFADKPDAYQIYYRDFAQLKKATLPKFLELSSNFETIPVSRIEFVKKGNTILFRRTKK